MGEKEATAATRKADNSRVEGVPKGTGRRGGF